MHIEIGKEARDPLSQHRLPDSRRAVEEHVMPSGCGHLAGPLGLHLTDHVCQIEAAIGVLAGLIAYHIDWLDQRHRPALQEGDQLSDRGNTEHLDPCNELGLSGLAQGTITAETCLLGRKSGRQDAADRPDRPSSPSSPSSTVAVISSARCSPAVSPPRSRDRNDCRPWARWPG